MAVARNLIGLLLFLVFFLCHVDIKLRISVVGVLGSQTAFDTFTWALLVKYRSIRDASTLNVILDAAVPCCENLACTRLGNGLGDLLDGALVGLLSALARLLVL